MTRAKRPAGERTTAVDGMVLLSVPHGYQTEDGRFGIRRAGALSLPPKWILYDRTDRDEVLCESLSAAVRLIREAREDRAIEAAS
jgi:hypothetical protein